MNSILDHVGIAASDMDRSKAFYAKALAPLGITLMMDYGTAVGFGKGKPDFWLGSDATKSGPITATHVCFAAASREEVDAFYRAAIEAGGKDNGAPGLRPMYHPNYYGAFVHDPDGHNVEAVFHGG